jgi:hypothetical protein
MQDTSKPVDRETLYDEVWTEPVSVVALRYGLSDVGLAKICRALAIPLPSRGYWAKVKAGRIMRRAPLPNLEQGERRIASLVKLPPEQVAVREAAKQSNARIRNETPSLPMEEVHSSPLHPLVRAASKRLRQRGGWPNDTLARSAPKEVLHLSVTQPVLERALRFTDGLLKVLTMHGFDFEIDKSRGVSLFRNIETNTRLEFILTEHIRRTQHVITPAEERAQKKYWELSRRGSSLSYPNIPRYDYTPTGILTVQVGRWPMRTWKDTPTKNLEQRLGEVIAGIVALAAETSAKEQEETRRQEAHRQAVARYEFLKQRRAEEAERFKSLETSVSNWERAVKLRAFADVVENNAKAAGKLSAEQLEWLAWVRAKADGLDPLVPVSDLILDAPEPRRPGYF